jgi:hypothetical protein
MKSHLQTANQPKTTITTTYGKGEGDLGVLEQTFGAMRLLETVADIRPTDTSGGVRSRGKCRPAELRTPDRTLRRAS